MVDLTRDKSGRVRARLLDLVPDRSGIVYTDWLKARGDTFRAGVRVATLDPFHGYKNAIDDQLEDATAVLDAFHIVALGNRTVDEVRRRVQQHTPPGTAAAPGTRSTASARACAAPSTSSPTGRRAAWTRRSPRTTATKKCTWRGSARSACGRSTTSAPRPTDVASPRASVASFPSCPIPEIARLGRTLRQWKDAFLAYFDTGGANNGGTEAINGLIELHRRIARGFRNRDNYRLRMLLIGGGLRQTDLLPPPQV